MPFGASTDPFANPTQRQGAVKRMEIREIMDDKLMREMTLKEFHPSPVHGAPLRPSRRDVLLLGEPFFFRPVSSPRHTRFCLRHSDASLQFWNSTLSFLRPPAFRLDPLPADRPLSYDTDEPEAFRED